MFDFDFMRHGLTDANERGILLGSTDAPLNERGYQQARQAGTALRDVSFDLILCSPLQRCVETAHVINRYRRVPVTIRFDYQLAERDFGAFEGLLRAFAPLDSDGNVAETGTVESITSVRQRAEAAIAPYVMRFRVLVVSHGGVFNALNSNCTSPLADKPGHCVPYRFRDYDSPYSSCTRAEAKTLHATRARQHIPQ